jgi:hypothetical protein
VIDPLMNADRPRRSPPRPLGILLVLLASLTLLAREGRAGCHVAATVDSARVAHLESLALAGAISLGEDGAQPVLPAGPCRGGMCSGRVPTPVAPEAPTLPDHERWLTSLPRPLPVGVERAPERPARLRVLPLHIPSVPDRPPRPVIS